MEEPAIKSIPGTTATQDVLKKPQREAERKRKNAGKQKRKKDPKRIIDTYA